MFVSYCKKSKKAKREDNNAKRKFWNFSPITRIKKSGKIYSRKEKNNGYCDF